MVSNDQNDHAVVADLAQQQAPCWIEEPIDMLNMDGNISNKIMIAVERWPESDTSQRHSPQSVRWLVENYETADGVSLPRSTLYSHYQTHCQQHGIEPVNAASFGKLIRSVFVGLRTRRLGTRGNSKYHYYGIRVKPNSPLARLTDSNSLSSTDSGQPPIKKNKSGLNGAGSTGYTANNGMKNGGVVNATDNHQATLAATSPEVLQSYLGDPKSILANVWPDEPIPSNDSESPSALATRFAAVYRKHYEQIISAIGNLNFNDVEELWRQFWQADHVNNNGNNSHDDSQSKSLPWLTLKQLHLLTSSPQVEVDGGEQESYASLSDWIIQTDYTLYNSLISSLLLPNLLEPIPQQLTQQIRNFAKSIENWMATALAGYDQSFIAAKVAAVGALSHTLKRYTCLNHLSSAARAVLQNQQQVQQMINDFNRVDFKNVQEQASWVCQCGDDIVDHIVQSFKMLLQQQNPSERWAVWCEQVLNACLQENACDVNTATQFILKWGFCTYQVINDLTLRSASSFGSFHLIKLLFNAYMLYLVEHKVAKASNKTALQVLVEARSLRSQPIGLEASETEGQLGQPTAST